MKCYLILALDCAMKRYCLTLFEPCHDMELRLLYGLGTYVSQTLSQKITSFVSFGQDLCPRLVLCQ